MKLQSPEKRKSSVPQLKAYEDIEQEEEIVPNSTIANQYKDLDQHKEVAKNTVIAQNL